jgi:hypothetical protein
MGEYSALFEGCPMTCGRNKVFYKVYDVLEIRLRRQTTRERCVASKSLVPLLYGFDRPIRKLDPRDSPIGLVI